MPCNETIDTAGVAKLYATYVFPHYGLPKKVISDRDPRFASNFSREMCNLLGIKQNISTAYHPQTDGQSERTNQSLEQYLRLYCGTHQKDWAAWLPLAQYTRNSWPNASTKKTPYELILGYTPLAHQPVRDTTVPDIDTRIQLIKNAREQAQEALKQTQENMIKETRFKEFVIGQQVWLEGKNIKRPYNSPKLSPKRYGPFRVVAKISPVAYKLQIPATWQYTTSSTRHSLPRIKKQWNTAKTSWNPLPTSSKEKRSGKSNRSWTNGSLVAARSCNSWSDGRATLWPMTSG